MAARLVPHAAGPVKAVDGVSLGLLSNERLGLVGESGSGKSTIALALMRLIRSPGRIEGGRVQLDGVNLLELGNEQMRRLRLATIALEALVTGRARISSASRSIRCAAIAVWRPGDAG